MITWEIPLKTVSEANRKEHWIKSAKRHRMQQFFIRALFRYEPKEIPFPCTITLTRVGPRFLDAEDNLPMSMKYIKDEIGAQLFPDKVITYRTRSGRYVKNKGQSDSDPLVTWKYAQEKGKIQGIRIEIRASEACAGAPGPDKPGTGNG